MKKVFGILMTACVSVSLMFLVGTGFAGDKASAVIEPAEISLTFPGILKTPITITGSGFLPGETLVVDLILPEGVKVPGVDPGESVGLAFGMVDDQSNFKTVVDASAKLNFLYRVQWHPNLQPDIKTLDPLPAGEYEISVSGMESGKVLKLPWKILPPPPKK